MTQRRPWTNEQDKALSHLKQALNIKKWSKIAKLMQSDFFLPGRNGKQCRQRYHNHLDHSIILKEINSEEEELLFKVHSQIGNKWSIIARQFPGRTDNFLKNHFHSKLRKAIRKLNKQIKEKLRKNSRQYKLTIIYKIVQASDYKFSSNICLSTDQTNFFQQLKNQLLNYAGGKTVQTYFQNMTQLEQVQHLIRQLELFQKSYINKAGKKQKKILPIGRRQGLSSPKTKCQQITPSQCEQGQQDLSFECPNNKKFELEQNCKILNQNQMGAQSTDKQHIISPIDSKFGNAVGSASELSFQVQEINKKAFYSFAIQKSQSQSKSQFQFQFQMKSNKQNNGIEYLVQQDQLPLLSMKKITFSQSCSMRMIDQSFQVEESQPWMRRLSSYQNIDQALFE